ncbi:DUF58 domain-containing protein [Cutibacterium sp. WCA-380-WT-3A]|uniref:DUF58 domain-containing protein n=1 Tax=Cutibacterium porci TaxID=2605781 RepID=A0A7K0J9H4_9ACTN|nr:DUF58 domain-containing protein [Cutibacterium porci]MSS46619.1 DUF58 domain-containing protein [Cutibacterium porci]
MPFSTSFRPRDMAYLRRIRTAVELGSRRKMHALMEGIHHSPYHARSLQFDDLRPYIPGDDMADVDWRATARSGEILVKQYVAERHQTVVIVVPTGADLCGAASVTETKADVALMVAGLFAWLALRQGDRVCVVSSRHGSPMVARPSSREVAVERMLVHAHQQCSLDNPTADLATLCRSAIRGVRSDGQAIVLLDDWEPDDDTTSALRLLAERRPTMAVTVPDADPTADSAVWMDLGRGRRVPRAFLADSALADELTEQRERRARERDEVLHNLGIAHTEVETTHDVVARLLTLVKQAQNAR